MNIFFEGISFLQKSLFVGKQLLKHGVKSSGFQFGVSHSQVEHTV